MAAPVVAEVAAQQVAQQKLQEEATQPKQGPSKFDNVLTDKTEATRGVQGVEEAQRTQQVHASNEVQKTQQVQASSETMKATDGVRPESVEYKKIGAIQVQALESAMKTQDARPESKVVGGMVEMLGDIEKGQGMMNQLMNLATSGKELSNSELLGLQAGMYKYTQELDLTSKVVEKATTGLKDTLKTQV